jgi:hypothetical protein
MTNTIKRQLSLSSIWDRLVRIVAVGAAFVVTLDRLPESASEWAALAVAIAAASYTGKGDGQ